MLYLKQQTNNKQGITYVKYAIRMYLRGRTTLLPGYTLRVRRALSPFQRR